MKMNTEEGARRPTRAPSISQNGGGHLRRFYAQINSECRRLTELCHSGYMTHMSFIGLNLRASVDKCLFAPSESFRFVFLVAAFAWIAFVPLQAQTPTPTPSTSAPQAAPIPPGPLIKGAPASSKWIVTFKYAEEKKKNKSDPKPEVRGTRVQQILAMRSGPVTYEEITDESGNKTEKWFTNDEIYIRKPGSSEFLTSGAKEITNANYESHSPLGFQGFDWISKTKFVGIQTILDRPCLVFSDQKEEQALLNPALFAYFKAMKADSGVKDGGSSGVSVGVLACIDLSTRLPVLLQIGAETRTFAFLEPPTTPVTLPAELAKLVAERQKLWHDATRAAAKP